jgi:5-methylcytosine-specific restriction endonuclease McrA
VDHRVPLALGGPDTEANCWALCASCDGRKTRVDLARIRAGRGMIPSRVRAKGVPPRREKKRRNAGAAA